MIFGQTFATSCCCCIDFWLFVDVIHISVSFTLFSTDWAIVTCLLHHCDGIKDAAIAGPRLNCFWPNIAAPANWDPNAASFGNWIPIEDAVFEAFETDTDVDDEETEDERLTFGLLAEDAEIPRVIEAVPELFELLFCIDAFVDAAWLTIGPIRVDGFTFGGCTPAADAAAASIAYCDNGAVGVVPELLKPDSVDPFETDNF